MKILIVFVILLASCSSSRKANNSSKMAVDSAAHYERDTLNTKRDDSTGVKKDKSTYTNNSDSGYERTTTEEEITYTQKEGAAHDSSKPDAQPGTTVKIFRRTTHEKGSKKIESKTEINRSDSSVKSVFDSTAAHEVGSTSVRKIQEEKSKTVSRRRFLPGIIWVLALLLIAWAARRFYLWKTKGIGFFSFINKRSTNDKEPDQKT